MYRVTEIPREEPVFSFEVRQGRRMKKFELFAADIRNAYVGQNWSIAEWNYNHPVSDYVSVTVTQKTDSAIVLQKNRKGKINTYLVSLK